MLDEVKEGIINAYEAKTGLSRQQLSDMMDAETWLSAKKAVELGFADRIMFEGEDTPDNMVSLSFSRTAVTHSLLSRIKAEPMKDVRIVLPTMAKREEAPAPTEAEMVQAAPAPQDIEQPPKQVAETPPIQPGNRVDKESLMHRLNLISH